MFRSFYNHLAQGDYSEIWSNPHQSGSANLSGTIIRMVTIIAITIIMIITTTISKIKIVLIMYKDR